MRTIAAIALLAALSLAANASTFDVAVTFDDLPYVKAPAAPLALQEEATKKLVAAISTRRIPAIGFVNGGKLLKNGALDSRELALLQQWLDAGFELGNHTQNHRDFHGMSEAELEREVIEGEAGLAQMLAAREQRLRWFRHPFLHTGTSREARDASEAFLAARGYRIAPVTIDNSDWIFAAAYDAAAEENDEATMRRIRGDYVAYMVATTEFFRRNGRELFGREIPQVLLVHASRLNGDAFGQLADALADDGARFVPLDDAVKDDAYRSADAYFGRGGISWIHRWALTKKMPRAFFANQPTTPPYVLRLANVESE